MQQIRKSHAIMSHQEPQIFENSLLIQQIPRLEK